MIRTILTQGDPALEKVCHPVTKFDQKLEKLLEDMRDTLIESNGVGLAAPQIGIIRRVVLVINEKNEIMWASISRDSWFVNVFGVLWRFWE